MEIALLDTNIVSALHSGDSILSAYFDSNPQRRLNAISFMTRAELLAWPKRNSWGPAKVAGLHTRIDRFVTLYPDDRLCERWAEIRSDSRRKGRPIDVADAWIAATALQFDIPLITRNIRHFDSIDNLEIILL